VNSDIVFQLGQLITIHPTEGFRGTEYVIFEMRYYRADDSPTICLQETKLLSGQRKFCTARELMSLLVDSPKDFITIPQKKGVLYGLGDTIELLPMAFDWGSSAREIKLCRVVKVEFSHPPSREERDFELKCGYLRYPVDVFLEDNEGLKFDMRQEKLYIYAALCKHIKLQQQTELQKLMPQDDDELDSDNLFDRNENRNSLPNYDMVDNTDDMRDDHMGRLYI